MTHRDKYNEYIASDHWKELRLKRIFQVGRKCEICTSTKQIQVHHCFYRNFTDCTEADLMVLCDRCHEGFHECVKYKGFTMEQPHARVKEFVRQWFGPAKVQKKSKRQSMRDWRAGKRDTLKEELIEFNRNLGSVYPDSIVHAASCLYSMDRELCDLFKVEYPPRKGWRVRLMQKVKSGQPRTEHKELHELDRALVKICKTADCFQENLQSKIREMVERHAFLTEKLGKDKTI